MTSRRSSCFVPWFDGKIVSIDAPDKPQIDGKPYLKKEYYIPKCILLYYVYTNFIITNI